MTRPPTVPLDAPRRTYDVAEAARLLGVGRTTLYDAIKAGRAPFRVIRVGGRVLVPMSEVARLLGEPEGRRR